MITREIFDKNTKWYEKEYNLLIDKGRKRGLNKKKLDYYTEKHHIVPKCMGGTNNRDNLVLLTYKEHIVAHRLLSRIYSDVLELKHAVYFMVNSPKNKYINIHSLNQLEELRLASIEYLRQINTGKVNSYETRRKISESKSNKILSLEARKSMALGRVGMVFTEERKRKISESMKGKTVSKETREKQSRVRKKKVVTPENTVFDDIKTCAKYLGIHENTLRIWIKTKPDMGYKFIENSGFRLIPVIDPSGEVHKSIRQCAKKYNREPKTIKNWIENYPEKGFRYKDS